MPDTSMRKFQMYKRLYARRDEMIEAARRLGTELGVPKNLRGKFGLTSAHSSFPGPIATDVRRAMDRASDEMRPLPEINDELRDAVKDFYGDEYDAVPIASGEAALWIAFESLVSPSSLGRGDAYRSRYIAPLERHVSHQSGFGRPFPPKYKYVAADRYATAGELGVEGKRLSNLDTVLVPFQGAHYDAHGIKYYPVPLLSTVRAKESAAKCAEVAARHGDSLSGFVSLAYDTPGYGYGEMSQNGAPLFQTLIGKLAQEYDVPYIVDDAWGAPILGTDIRKTGASLVLYSGDKVMGGPLSGLLIGRDDAIIPVRRAMGTHSHRHGNPSAYAKAMFSAFDPGREAVVALAYIVRKLRDSPGQYTGPVDSTYKIVKEELAASPLDSFKKDMIVTKTYNNLSVEVNYDRTWTADGEGKLGIPIFSEEDSFAGTLPFEYILNTIGVLPTITYDGNILIAPGHGTVDEDGRLIEERMRLGVKAMFGALEIVCREAGVLS